VECPSDNNHTASQLAHCSGDPCFHTPSSHFRFHGEELVIPSERISQSQDGLHIDPAQPQDAGTYHCLVTVDLTGDSAESTGSLTVQSAPNITLFDVPGVATGGQRLNITCSASGVPDPSVIISQTTERVHVSSAISWDRRAGERAGELAGERCTSGLYCTDLIALIS